MSRITPQADEQQSSIIQLSDSFEMTLSYSTRLIAIGPINMLVYTATPTSGSERGVGEQQATMYIETK
jgi:hypothetical protein